MPETIDNKYQYSTQTKFSSNFLTVCVSYLVNLTVPRSGEITRAALLKKYEEVPLLLNLTKGKNEEEIKNHLKDEHTKNNDEPNKLKSSIMLFIINIFY